MKNGITARLLAVCALLAASVMTGWSQEANEKFAMTTQMFLNRLKEQAEPSAASPTSRPRRQPGGKVRPKQRRLIASPDTVGDVAYVPCFIHLKDAADLSAVSALGVDVEESFGGLDFVTARVPVGQLEALAALDNVTRIKVARRAQPQTDVARQATNAADLLTVSPDALACGVTGKYDGSGVILGIIDTGIDFRHTAFKDKNGNSRIKRAYVYDGKAKVFDEDDMMINPPTTDDNKEDHGTHTASTAGGSSVVVSGSTVTVTDDHANATYGGMAPGADLYLAGIKGLDDVYIATALQRIVTYADSQGKPLVVSNSWGNYSGPHDGTGELAEVVGKYFGKDHPNRVILFAAANAAGRRTGDEVGGFFVRKRAVSSSPLGTIIRTNNDGGNYYADLIASAMSARKLNCKLYVLDNSAGTIKKSWTVAKDTRSFSELATYYSGSLAVYFDVENGKYQLAVVSEDGMEAEGDYTLAIEVYPASGSADVDLWAGDRSYFTDHLSTSGHTWTAGTDDMCVSDEATIPDAISVGAYVSKNQVTNSQGRTYTYTSGSLGDIAYFSSYATADLSPTGLAYPWITAPGAQVVAAVNHYDTSGDNSYFDSLKSMLVVNDANNPYGVMAGTSMATPVAAGIVALWLQAAQEVNKPLTVDDVKNIMKLTAVSDSYTTGTNASHFGNGKIDALAGVKLILGDYSSPVAPPAPATTAETVDFSTKGYDNAQTVASVSGSACTVAFNKGSNSRYVPTYYDTGRAIRLYAGNTMTIASPTKTIIKIELAFSTGESTNAITTDVGSYSDGTWTGSASSVTFTVSGSSGHRRIQKLTVTYQDDGSGTTPGTDTDEGYYVLTTEAGNLKAGDKILIACIDGDTGQVLSTTQNAINRVATDDVTVNCDGTLTPGKAAQVITLEKEGSNFLFNVGNGYLYAASNTANCLKTTKAADANALATVSISDGDATITFQGEYTRNTVRYNPNNGSPIFSCYSTGYGKAPQIYRLVPASAIVKGDADGDGDVDAADVTLTVNYLLGLKPAGFIKAAADMNDDGVVDITDVTAIVSAALRRL